MKKYVTLALVLFLYLIATAQNKLLQKTVSVDFRNITMYDALMQIESKAGIYFSYDNQFIKNQKRLSFASSNKSVKEVLDMILDNEYHYIINNNKIVIRKKEPEYIVVQGQFTDNTDHKPIEYVTVYAPDLKLGTVSNESGKFSITLPLSNTIRLQANRISYYDTSFTMDIKSNPFLQMELTPKVYTEDHVIIRSVERHWLAKAVIGTRQKVNSINLKNYFYQRKFQLGVWPRLGTKNALKGQQENKISFNVFGGYSAQVDAFEIGGLFNIVQKHVRSVQVAGLFNVVGGTVNGLQVAGLHNYVGDDVNGLQIAGLVNLNKTNNTSLHVGSLFNRYWRPVTDKTSSSGLQIGGLYNQNQQFRGLQIAGLVNNSQTITSGMQISGVASRTSIFKKGMQLSGLVSGAKSINGAQVSGVLNVAKVVNGFQFGIFNIADTLNGVAIGPFNYSSNGKHALSVSIQENNQLNVSYKSGSYALYNILQAGFINAGATGSYYIFGYGLGSEWRLKKKLKMATELINLYYTPTSTFETDYGTVLIQPLLIYPLHKNIQLFAGPRLEYQLPLYNHNNKYYHGLHRNSVFISEGRNTALYLGFNLGVNIF